MTVLDWVEEFKTLKTGKLDLNDKTKNKNQGKELKFQVYSELKGLEECKISSIDKDNIITISDEMISQIEESYFNIFDLEKEVGENNILSTIICYVFSSMGFYSFINYSKFENFIHEITNGYNRKNPYHNVSC